VISLGTHTLLHGTMELRVSITSMRNEDNGRSMAFGAVFGNPALWVGQTVDIAHTDVRAIVRRIDIECDVHEVTLGPEAFKLGLEPSRHREWIPGMKSATIELLLLRD
jgi:hypothetical protein